MSSEQILVVPREVLGQTIAHVWSPASTRAGLEQGVLPRSSRPILEPFGNTYVAWEALKAMSGSYRFVERDDAENDPSLKQIIPYVIIRYGTCVLLMRRLHKQSESRLWDKLSLGIGGHVNPEDGTDFFDAFLSGMERELHEELYIPKEYACRLVGCINDDTTDVGKVHFGIVFQALFANDSVRIRETSKMTGEFIEIKELASIRPQMESWSQIVFDHFLSRLV